MNSFVYWLLSFLSLTGNTYQLIIHTESCSVSYSHALTLYDICIVLQGSQVVTEILQCVVLNHVHHAQYYL